MKAGLIVHRQGFWAYDTVLACKELQLYAVSNKGGVFPGPSNPYQLEESADLDVIYVGSHTWRHFYRSYAEEKHAIEGLKKFATCIVLIDGWDSFDLSIKPETVELFDCILKTNGVYKDRDLYNWKVGCDFPGANWTQKIVKKDWGYTKVHLDKISLSFPCTIGVTNKVKSRLRKYNNELSGTQTFTRNQIDRITKVFVGLAQHFPGNRRETLFFLGDYAHEQRYELLQLLRNEEISGYYKFSRVHRMICGREDWRNQPVSDEEYARLLDDLNERGLMSDRKNRLAYLMLFFKYRLAISPVGFGEMCFRHLELMQMGNCGIIQDLSHIDHLAPFRPDENILYCRPDFSDLLEKIRWVEENPKQVAAIGKKAFRDARKWEKSIDQILKDSLVTPLKN